MFSAKLIHCRILISDKDTFLFKLKTSRGMILL